MSDTRCRRTGLLICAVTQAILVALRRGNPADRGGPPGSGRVSLADNLESSTGSEKEGRTR